jgi:hypothetical protein
MVLALREGAAIGARDACGNTALHRAALHGNIEGVELLLSAGANPLIANGIGQTPADGKTRWFGLSSDYAPAHTTRAVLCLFFFLTMYK